ncbi:MAG TPA: bifunctional glycosyltransferase/class I SAM-dependent methyltransferase, partial [bacterium]|nr:bifunctional glycosyltransferase/class I SAM-dependent methyltransferase [bacterium]
ALAGGMPLYKWFGNQVLTYLENKLLNLKLSEFHTGFRAYNIHSLKKAPFEFNSDNFHFDTEIIIQAKALNWQIIEISLPAYYGSEKCRVNGTKYAINCLKSVIRYKLVRLGIFYTRNFDFGIFENDNYQFKKSKYSLHQYIVKQFNKKENITTIELGANKGILSEIIAQKVNKHYAIDMIIPEKAENAIKLQTDLNSDFTQLLKDEKFDVCISLDTIEHLDHPEEYLKKIFKIMKPHSKLYISTANIAYLPVRISLLLGQLNYGKRGILDMTHKRLYTIPNFKLLLEQYGFKVEKIIAFPPPISDLISKRKFMQFIEKLHYHISNFWKNLFAYNFLVIARRTDSLEEIFEKTINKKT